MTISGGLLLDVEMANSWDGPRSFRNSLAAYTERTQECLYIIGTFLRLTLRTLSSGARRPPVKPKVKLCAARGPHQSQLPFDHAGRS